MEEEIQALETVLNTIIDFFVNYSFQVAGAILILIIGLIVARYTASVVLKLLERKDLDVTLSKFIAGTINGTREKEGKLQAPGLILTWRDDRASYLCSIISAGLRSNETTKRPSARIPRVTLISTQLGA